MFNDISEIFPEPLKTKDILKDIFSDEKERVQNLEDIAYTLGQMTKRDKAKQQQFMGFLIQLAFVDGEVSPNEDKILQKIAEAFEFDPNIYHKIFDQFEQMIKNIHPQANIDDAYKILGVNKDDNMDIIKKAYRKLIRKYHPDIIKSQDKNEDYMEEATKKTQEIHTYWRKVHGRSPYYTILSSGKEYRLYYI
jgi:DnaJ like chaperone protein